MCITIMYISAPKLCKKKKQWEIFAERERKREKKRARERYVLTEAKALPSASPVCELPVGVPRFVTAKKKTKNIVGGFVKVTQTNGNWSQDTIHLFNCLTDFFLENGCWAMIKTRDTARDILGRWLIYQQECLPMTPSVVVADGVWAAVTNGEVLVLLRWKLDMGGRLALMSGETACAGKL